MTCAPLEIWLSYFTCTCTFLVMMPFHSYQKFWHWYKTLMIAPQTIRPQKRGTTILWICLFSFYNAIHMYHIKCFWTVSISLYMISQNVFNEFNLHVYWICILILLIERQVFAWQDRGETLTALIDYITSANYLQQPITIIRLTSGLHVSVIYWSIKDRASLS